jgi:uncharacterized protein YegL
MLQVYLLLDLSASMSGAPLEALKQGVSLARTVFAERVGNGRAVQIAVIGYHSTAQLLVPLSDVAAPFPLPDLQAGGTSRLGAAFRLLTEQLDQSNSHSVSPSVNSQSTLVYIFTDGDPNDDWPAALDQVRPRVTKIYGLACGLTTQADQLKPFSDQVLMMGDLTPDALFSTIRMLVN